MSQFFTEICNTLKIVNFLCFSRLNLWFEPSGFSDTKYGSQNRWQEPVGPCESVQPAGGQLQGSALGQAAVRAGQDAGGAGQDLGHLGLPGRPEGGLLLPAALPAAPWGPGGGAGLEKAAVQCVNI